MISFAAGSQALSWEPRREAPASRIPADESLNWRPNSFGYGSWGSETAIRFPVVKMIDYLNCLDVLENSHTSAFTERFSPIIG